MADAYLFSAKVQFFRLNILVPTPVNTTSQRSLANSTSHPSRPVLLRWLFLHATIATHRRPTLGKANVPPAMLPLFWYAIMQTADRLH